MITSFSCTCGNTDPKKASEYDGALGYEAMICLECARYYDHEGEHAPDEWSRSYLPGWRAPVIDATPPAGFPDQVLVLDPDAAKRHPGKGYYLRVQTAGGVDTVHIDGEHTLPGARAKAEALGYRPSHWLELPSGYPIRF